MPSSQWDRLAVISELVGKAGTEGLGRTALMKCLYFLEVLRGVWLEYDFRLYTYGPFDADVLDDLGYAESLSAVTSEVVTYPRGYAYLLRKGPGAKVVKARGILCLKKHKADIDWVFDTFAKRTASDLEMMSTLIFVDRETHFSNCITSIEELSRSVCEIKPHFPFEQIRKEAELMKNNTWFRAVA